MAEIINLRRSRKQKEKAKERDQAAENRRLHGRTKGEKQVTDFHKDKNTKSVDNAQLDKD